MLQYEIFDIKFPYLTNGGLFWAKILTEKRTNSLHFHILPLNRVDFTRFELTRDEKGNWITTSDYSKQKEFFESVCGEIDAYIKKSEEAFS